MARPAAGLGMRTPCDRGHFVVPASPYLLTACRRSVQRGVGHARPAGGPRAPSPLCDRGAARLPSLIAAAQPYSRAVTPDNSLYNRHLPRRAVNSLGGGGHSEPNVCL